MIKVHRVFRWLFIAIGFCGLQFGYGQSTIQSDSFVTDTLKDGSYIFPLSLDSGRFIFGYVNQIETDLRVQVLDPNEEVVTISDDLVRGRESFYFETKKNGSYKIKLNGESGIFEFRIVKNEPIANQRKNRVAQWMSPYDNANSPGVAVLVTEGENILLESYAGMANLTYKIPMDPSTRHNIGSTSKHFTAFGLMLLVDQNKVNLSDDVRKYLPELPEFVDTVRLHHLLTHTSGYREFLNTILMMGQHPSTPLSREKILAIIERQPQLQDKPGSVFNYNNTAYAMIAEIVERVSGQPFENYMKEMVFAPLEMNHTQYRSHNREIIPNRSTGYSPSEEDEYQSITDLGGGMGAGGLYITLSDFNKWINHLSSPIICDPAIIDRMTTPDTLISGEPTGYGFGLFIQEYKGQRYIHHGGADLAHRSHMLIFPDIPGAVIVQSNMSTFKGDLPFKIANLYFEKYFSKPENQPTQTDTASKAYTYDIEKFEQIKGRFALDIAPGFILRFFTEEEKLMIQATGQPALELHALSDSTFNITAVPNASITIHTEGGNRVDSLTLHQGGHLKARRLHWTPDSAQLEGYTGTYYSKELETVVQVEQVGADLQIQHYRLKEPFALAPTQKDQFSSTANSGAFGEIEYHRNEQGLVDGMWVSNGRTKNIWFQLLNETIKSLPIQKE